jgi:hypothetical protein
LSGITQVARFRLGRMSVVLASVAVAWVTEFVTVPPTASGKFGS